VPRRDIGDEQGRAWDKISERVGREDQPNLSGNSQGTFQPETPELYGEEPYTEIVDVFLFVLVLCEILVGRSVFSAKLSASQIMFNICSDGRADFPSGMNDDVKSLINRGWSKDPGKRQSFSDILAELKRIRFMILPEVDSIAVDLFLREVLYQAGQPRNAAGKKTSHQT
jgi:hypothetical protein